MTQKRIDIIEMERLRALDMTLEGSISANVNFIAWIKGAVRRGNISQDSKGFFLSVEQIAYWRERETQSK
jgi:hypothetical protein